MGFTIFSQTQHKKQSAFSPAFHLYTCLASPHHIFTAKYSVEQSGLGLANSPPQEIEQSLTGRAKCSVIYGVHVGEKISCQKKVSSGHITFAVLFYSRIMAFGPK